jgi:hypothetical protein
MTYASDHFMDHVDHDLRRRLSRFLRSQYPTQQEGRLARDIGCDKRTAKNLFNEHWPRAEHMAAIVRRFGRDVLAAVFEPEINHVLARLTAEERLLEERLNEARARRRQAQGGGESPAHRVAEVADEKCALTADLFD